MEPAEPFDREVDGRLHLIRVADVGLCERSRAPELRSQRLAALGVDVGDDDLSTFLDEALDDPAPDPARTAGDDGDLAGRARI